MVFGAVAFLIKAAKNITAKYDAIVDLMETLKVCDVQYFRSAAKEDTYM
jgi:hypothetical protein